MIHTLKIVGDLDPTALKKLARKLAMTGGYELSLAKGLSENEQITLIDWYLPLALEYPRDQAVFRSNNAFRILKLLYESDQITPPLKSLLDQKLFSFCVNG